MGNDVLNKIFFEQSISRENKFINNEKRLAYYTSICIAESIIEKKVFWMRNVGDMNDCKEVKYGNSLISRVLYGNMRKEFEDALEKNTLLSKVMVGNILDKFREEMIGKIEESGEELKRYKKDEIESYIINALRYAVVSIKHPGFEDEQEWRLVAHGNDLNLDVEKVKGLLQPIYKLKISDCIFREGLEKVIFAPSTNILTCKAFVQLLCKNLGISKEEAERKIFMSSIPYR